jgi:ATP-dependent Clp protease ATP-binding subunit ClpC
VVRAQEEARDLDHDYIGTEHLLLGLLRQPNGMAAQALMARGLQLDEARRHVEELVGRGNGAPPAHIPFTPRAKKVLELSLREALQLKHNYIGSEHILLGLLREGQGIAVHVLTRSGLNPSEVRATVLEMLERTDVVADPHDPVVFEPARCSVCGTTSPECGPLYVRAIDWTTTGRLFCERCIASRAAT